MSEEKGVIVIEASSLEEAKVIAAQEWGISPGDVVVNLVEEEKKLFGILGKRLKVEVRPLYPLDLIRAQKMLGELLKKMDLNVSLANGG
ncbi:MAG: Jag N-terminal domain-containing protein [Acetomicrobium sp.]